MKQLLKPIIVLAAVAMIPALRVTANSYYARISADSSSKSPTGAGQIYIDNQIATTKTKESSTGGNGAIPVYFQLKAEANNGYYFCGWSKQSDADRNSSDLVRENPYSACVMASSSSMQDPTDGGTYYAVFDIRPYFDFEAIGKASETYPDAAGFTSYIENINHVLTTDKPYATADAVFLLSEIRPAYKFNGWTEVDTEQEYDPASVVISVPVINENSGTKLAITATAEFSECSIEEAPGLAVCNCVLGMNQTAQLSVTLPDESSGWTVSYSSTNEDIVSVDENGVLTGNKTGKAHVIVSISKGEMLHQVAGLVEITTDFQIKNVEEFQSFVQSVNDGNNSISANLVNDLDLSDIGNEAIIGNESYKYLGTFEGNGHTVKVDLDNPQSNPALISELGGKVRNLKVTGKIVTNTANAAGIASCAYDGALIENCVSEVAIQSDVNGAASHGGIVGKALGAEIRNCCFVGSISGEYTNGCGGVVGDEIEPCQVSGCYVAATFDIISDDCALFVRNSTTLYPTCYAAENLESFGLLQGGKYCTGEQIENGELCYIMNDFSNSENPVWRQNLSGLNKDIYPVPMSDHMKVSKFMDFYANADAAAIIGDDLHVLKKENDIYTTDDDIDLQYGNRYVSEHSFTAPNLKYSFPAAPGLWNPWFVPFSVTTSELEAQNLTAAIIAGVRQYEKDEDGNMLTQVDIIKLSHAVLRPCTPYLVRSTDSRTVIDFTIGNVDMSSSTEIHTVSTSTALASYDFIGTYSRIVSDDFDPEYKYYIMSNGALGITDSYVPSIYWYMKAKSKDPMYDELPVSGVIKVCIVGEENGTTGVRTIYPVEQQSTEVYDLSGMRQQGLNSGMINIVNGKKYLVK